MSARSDLKVPSTCFQAARKRDRKSTRLNSSHVEISYAVFCLKKKNRRGISYRSKSAPRRYASTSRLLCLCECVVVVSLPIFFFFFFNDTATTEIYTLSLHDALPISIRPRTAVEGAAGKRQDRVRI